MSIDGVRERKKAGEFVHDWFFGGGIGLKHKVTGEELNELTEQVRVHLVDVNNNLIGLTGEFGQVYNALEALDKDLIRA